VKDIDAALATLAERGVTSAAPSAALETGAGRRGVLTGPDGVRVELLA
jgi:hypothetical protein